MKISPKNSDENPQNSAKKSEEISQKNSAKNLRALIVAFSENRAIGFRGEIPWAGKLAADMKFVRARTANSVLIMGKNTFLSIGKPLQNRENIVLSNDEKFREKYSAIFPNLIFARNLDESFAISARDFPEKNVFIFGGAKVYAESLLHAKDFGISKIFATEIHENFDGDAFFPQIDLKIWREISRKTFCAGEKNLFDFDFAEYEII